MLRSTDVALLSLLEENVITSELLEAYLACPLKCYLRSIGERCAGNKFSAWYETRKETYRRVGTGRFEASLSQGLIRNQIAPRDFRKAQWQLALNQVLDTDDLSANIHAIQRVPAEGRLSDFIPVRFVHLNKLSRANKMTAMFDAIVLSKVAGQPISVAKVIHGDAWPRIKRVIGRDRCLSGYFFDSQSADAAIGMAKVSGVARCHSPV